MLHRPDRDALIAAYTAVSTPLDRLPYSFEMDLLLSQYAQRARNPISAYECWRTLLDLRKRGRLPRIRRR